LSDQERDVASELARRLWIRVEQVHAIVYFDDRVAAAVADTGLQGWWAGYVAGRAAPLGRVPAEVVQALFFGFSPRRIARGVPGAWTVVEPEVLVRIRTAAVAAALRKALDDHVEGLERMDDLLGDAVAGCDVAGRGLFAAHLALPEPDDAVQRWWHRCTLLREHRGDGHVAACVDAGLDGVTANQLAVLRDAVPGGGAQRRNRGWSESEWSAGWQRLELAGLVHDGEMTDAGLATVSSVEARTDRAAAAPVRALGAPATEELIDLLDRSTSRLRERRVLPFPNAVGVPADDPTGSDSPWRP
jgi:hypothetical protein